MNGSGAEQLMCPWDGYSPATVQFCESRLCGWVSEPANAWSNVAFVLVGAFLLVRAAQLRKGPLALIGVTSTLVGIGSFLFHMSGTLFGELVDVSTMLLISGLMLTLELRRLVKMTAVQTMALYVAVNGLFELLLLTFPDMGIPLFASQIALFIAAHVACRVKKLQADYHFMRWLFWAFSVAFTVWVLDWTGTACDAQMHIFNGHAVWHVLNAVCMYFYFRYQAQFFTPGLVLVRAESRSR